MFSLKYMETNRTGCYGFTEKFCYILLRIIFTFSTQDVKMLVIIFVIIMNIITKITMMVYNKCMRFIANITKSTRECIQMLNLGQQTETATGNSLITITIRADN